MPWSPNLSAGSHTKTRLLGQDILCVLRNAPGPLFSTLQVKGNLKIRHDAEMVGRPGLLECRKTRICYGLPSFTLDHDTHAKCPKAIRVQFERTAEEQFIQPTKPEPVPLLLACHVAPRNPLDGSFFTSVLEIGILEIAIQVQRLVEVLDCIQ